MANWTNEQLEAIYGSGSSIIVSAGAGSGKTAVLTERVIEKLKANININNLIVLTFTNAAAFEMKGRIKDSIKKIPELKEQLNLIDSSYITTFDSYSLSLVRKYHYLLNISKDISIIDSVLLEIKKKEIIDSIFEKKYSDLEFTSFIDTFTTKDDDRIKEYINNLLGKINSVADKNAYLNNYLEVHFNDDFINNQINNYINILDSIKESIFEVLEVLKDLAEDEIVSQFILNINNSLENLESAKKYEDYLFINEYKLPSFPTSKKIDEANIESIKLYFSKLRDYISNLKDLVTYDSVEDIKSEIISTKPYIKVIIDLIKEYDEEILKYKKSINAFEFSDIMRFSIELLKNNPEIVTEIKNNTNEIMVDEFQDTNDIGEYFLSLISNNNLYMVGDVKQSIYKFRNANPKIFTDTYLSYKKGNGKCIDLNKNFRSREEVLNNINLIFENVMDSFLGGVDYDDGQKLVCGSTIYEKVDNSNMELLNYEYKNSILAKTYTKDEIEVFIIADDIINKMNTIKVTDKETKTLRKPIYNDFAILVDRKSNFDLFKQIFEYKGIPLTIHKDENFSYTNEMYTLKNLFKLINCFKNNDFKDLKYSFISVARSYILEFNDSIIYDNIDNILECDLFKGFFDKIEYLANYSNTNSLSNLINETYKEFDLYLKTIKIGGVNEVNIKLEYLVNIAKNLEQIGYNLNDFIMYFDSIFDMKTDITFSLSKDTKKDAVNIMTIHKSKGLEFPICYFPSLYKEFNVRDVYDSFLFDNEIGIISPTFKEGIKDTIYKSIVKNNYLLEDISERIRVLYVALTRAKEKIVFVSNFNDYDEVNFENGRVSNMLRLEYRSFLDIILSIKKQINHYIKTIKPNVNKEYEQILNKNYHELLSKNNSKFGYLNVNIEKVKEEKVKYSKQHLILEDNENLALGTNIHEVLEYLDFNNYIEDINNYEINDTLKEKIKTMFTMPFMNNLSNSQIFKELSIDDNKGSIDLLISNDKLIIVDYKIKEIDKKEYFDQVNGYIKYIKTKTNKEVEGYLYSILDCKYIKVK